MSEEIEFHGWLVSEEIEFHGWLGKKKVPSSPPQVFFSGIALSGREENDRRNYFMINLHESMVPSGIELATPGSAARHAAVARHVTDCAMWPGAMSADNQMQTVWKKMLGLIWFQTF